MSFETLAQSEQVRLIKREFVAIVSNVFEHPKVLIDYWRSDKLSAEQARDILLAVNKLNMTGCACCRVLDISRLDLKKPDENLALLICMAQDAAKSKTR